jgi:hypothetical protein
MEIWKEIQGFEGLYEASTYGRIKSLPKFVLNNRGGGYTKEKIKSTQLNHKGYETVSLSKNGIDKRVFVHRLIALTFISNPDNKPQINHKDGNKLNNHYDNLEWNTNQENQLHAYKTGLNKSHRANVKLTLEQIESIKKEYIPKVNSQTKIAKKYGVHKSTIQAIISGRNWS